MLIRLDELNKKFNMNITGILHIGAHKCEELDWYSKEGIKNVFWVEAIKHNVDEMRSKHKGINIYKS